MYYKSCTFLVVDGVMALPLESNVDDADEADDGGLAAMEKMLAYSAKKASEEKRPSNMAKEKRSPKKSKSPKKVNLQPEVIIEVEETEVARQKGHMVIGLENPNSELEMVILVSWSRKENVPFQFLLTLLCYCSSYMVQLRSSVADRLMNIHMIDVTVT